MTADRARDIVLATAAEFLNLVNQGSSEGAMEELLLRMIWHLNQEGTAGRQKNPSGIISKDKLTVLLTDEHGFHAYDVLSTRISGSMDVHFDEVMPAQYVQERGIADEDHQPPAPEPPSRPVISYDETKSIEFGLACNNVYKESGATFDPGMISVHSMRCAWDYYVGGVTWEQAKHKHVNEFRAEYGLPPLV